MLIFFPPVFSDGTKTLKPRAQTLQVVALAEEGKSVGRGEREWLPVRTLLATFLAKRCDKLEETVFRKYFQKWVSKSVTILWGENSFAPELTQTNAFGSDCPAAHCQVQYHRAVHGNCGFFPSSSSPLQWMPRCSAVQAACSAVDARWRAAHHRLPFPAARNPSQLGTEHGAGAAPCLHSCYSLSLRRGCDTCGTEK